MAVTIRTATPDDLHQVERLGAEMHAQTNFAALRYDPTHFAGTLQALHADADHTVLVAAEGETLAGFILCGCAETFFGPDTMAYELAWYVTPAYRGTGAGQNLLIAFREWAQAQGATRIQAGNSAGMPDEIYTRVLAHAGFQRAGSLMYLNP